jgi:hypothetical protein
VGDPGKEEEEEADVAQVLIKAIVHSGTQQRNVERSGA